MDLTYDNLYNEPSSLNKIAGSWTNATGVVLTILQDGTMSAHDAATGCDIKGQLSIIDASYNAYSASATYSGCLGSAIDLNGLTATGLFALDDLVTPNILIAGYSLTLPGGQVVIVVANATRS